MFSKLIALDTAFCLTIDNLIYVNFNLGVIVSDTHNTLFNRAIFDKAKLFCSNSETDKEHLPRCWGCSYISFNVVKECFGELYASLKFIFDLSLEKEMLPGDLKIVRFTPVFKGGDHSE